MTGGDDTESDTPPPAPDGSIDLYCREILSWGTTGEEGSEPHDCGNVNELEERSPGNHHRISANSPVGEGSCGSDSDVDDYYDFFAWGDFLQPAVAAALRDEFFPPSLQSEGQHANVPTPDDPHQVQEASAVQILDAAQPEFGIDDPDRDQRRYRGLYGELIESTYEAQVPQIPPDDGPSETRDRLSVYPCADPLADLPPSPTDSEFSFPYVNSIGDSDSGGYDTLAYWHSQDAGDTLLPELDQTAKGLALENSEALQESFHFAIQDQLTLGDHFPPEAQSPAWSPLDPALEELQDFLLTNSPEPELPETGTSTDCFPELQVSGLQLILSGKEGLPAMDHYVPDDQAWENFNLPAEAQPQVVLDLNSPDLQLENGQHPQQQPANCVTNCSSSDIPKELERDVDEESLTDMQYQALLRPEDFCKSEGVEAGKAANLSPVPAESTVAKKDHPSSLVDDEGYKVPSLPVNPRSKEVKIDNIGDGLGTGRLSSPRARKESPNASKKRSPSANKRRQLFSSSGEPADSSRRGKPAEKPKCPATPLQKTTKEKTLRRSSSKVPSPPDAKIREEPASATAGDEGTMGSVQRAKSVLQVQPFSIVKPSEALGQTTLESINRRIRSAAERDPQPPRRLPPLSRDGLRYTAWSLSTAPEGKFPSSGTVNVFRRRLSFPE